MPNNLFRAERQQSAIRNDAASRKDGILWVSSFFDLDPCDQRIDLAEIEPGHPDIEAKIIKPREGLKLAGEELFVPTGVQRELVVRRNVSAFLIRRHVFEPNARYPFHTDQFRGLDPAMSSQDRIGSIDPYRDREPECLDALADLAELLFEMRAGVKRPWL